MVLLTLYLALAIGVSFLCSILEAVLLSVTPAYVRMLEDEGRKSAARLKALKRNVDRPLAAILSLNTIAHTVGAAGVGAQAQLVFGNAYVTVTSAVLTLAILVFSEIIPKTVGAVHWRRLAPASAVVTGWLVILTWPLVMLARGITRWLGGGDGPPRLTRAEFGAIAELGREQGLIAESESRIVRNLIVLDALRVADIMTPRVVVQKLPLDLSVEDAVARLEESPFSRLPVYAESDEDIRGYVLRTDLILALARDDHDQDISEHLREVKIIPEVITLKDLFRQFLESREHFAVVVDEYGSLAGVVTMEDLMETLLGTELVDETDTIEDLQKIARDNWTRRARRLGIELPEDAGGASGSD